MEWAGQWIQKDSGSPDLRPSIRAVYTQATETSTGVAHPIKEIGEVLRRYHETFGVERHHRHRCIRHAHGQWGLDVVISGPEALMLPPGWPSPAPSEKAWTFVERPIYPSTILISRGDEGHPEESDRLHAGDLSPVGLRESLRLIRQRVSPRFFGRHERWRGRPVQR